MKLLYIINDIDWFWSHRFKLALAAKTAGYDVYVAAPDAEQQRQKLNQYGFKVAELPRSNCLKSVTCIRSLIKTHAPDLVHTITLKMALDTALAISFLKRKPAMFYTIAGLGHMFSPYAIKSSMMRPAFIPVFKRVFKHGLFMFQNTEDRDEAVTRGMVRQSQCHMIAGSGVNLEKFEASEETPNDTPSVLLPTRLLADKGIKIFVEAAKIVKQRGIDVKFEIAGGISSKSHTMTERQIKRYLRGSDVQWLGHVNNMPQKLANSHLIVYPSYYREGVPKVLLEAAATGRAIVTTDHAGCRDVVEHDINGLLVPIRDAEATANAIIHLIENPKKRQKMGRAGRAIAEQIFDVQNIIAQTLGYYATAKTASISTATSNGREGAPTANLAC